MTKAEPKPRKTELRDAFQGLKEMPSQGLEANWTWRAVLANLRHELRTPLNAIIGYSEMLLEDAEGQGKEDYISDLGKTHSAGKQLLALVDVGFELPGALPQCQAHLRLYGRDVRHGFFCLGGEGHVRGRQVDEYHGGPVRYPPPPSLLQPVLPPVDALHGVGDDAPALLVQQRDWSTAATSKPTRPWPY